MIGTNNEQKFPRIDDTHQTIDPEISENVKQDKQKKKKKIYTQKYNKVSKTKKKDKIFEIDYRRKQNKTKKQTKTLPTEEQQIELELTSHQQPVKHC